MHCPSIARILVVAGIAFSGFSAGAATEVEPNDALAAAQFISTGGTDFMIGGARTFADPSDDFFSFDVGGSGFLTISSSSADLFADSILGLFGPDGTLLASADDGAAGSMSALTYFVAAGSSGRYTIGFSGYNPLLLSCSGDVTECYDISGDFVFDNFVAGGGAGGSTGWEYTIDVAGVPLIPEPGTIALWALGTPLLVAVARRRRVRH